MSKNMKLIPIDFRGRLIVHLGTHKTGTTSIQNALNGSYDTLRKSGILFPKAGRIRNDKTVPLHHPLILSLIDEKDQDQPASRHIDALRDEIGETCPSTVVLSSEVLSREYLSSQVFRDLKTIFPSAQRTWVVYLRRQDDLAMSRYAEAIKVGILSWPDSIRHILRPDALDHRLRLERLKYAVGDDEIVPVSFDAQKERLIFSFFEASKLATPDPLPESRKDNTSLPWTTLYCLRITNAFPAPIRRFGRRVVLGISRRVFEKKVGRIFKGSSPLSPKEAERILKRYEDSNRWVEEEYWNGTQVLTIVSHNSP